ncbi:MAG: hypothetical protein ACRDST_09705 [Pseudonocardiaceae bacterium]
MSLALLDRAASSNDDGAGQKLLIGSASLTLRAVYGTAAADQASGC